MSSEAGPWGGGGSGEEDSHVGRGENPQVTHVRRRITGGNTEAAWKVRGGMRKPPRPLRVRVDFRKAGQRSIMAW